MKYKCNLLLFFSGTTSAVLFYLPAFGLDNCLNTAELCDDPDVESLC